jgi:hypothetical protein
MNPDEKLWNVYSKKVMKYGQYSEQIKNMPLVAIKASDQAMSAVIQYQLMIDTLNATKYQMQEQLLNQKLEGCYALQALINKDRIAVLEGIKNVRAASATSISSIITEQRQDMELEASAMSSRDEVILLIEKKARLEENLKSLERAVVTKNYQPVESILLSKDEEVSSNMIRSYRFSWHSKLSEYHTIVSHTYKLFEESLYCPILGKHPRSPKNSPRNNGAVSTFTPSFPPSTPPTLIPNRSTIGVQTPSPGPNNLLPEEEKKINSEQINEANEITEAKPVTCESSQTNVYTPVKTELITSQVTKQLRVQFTSEPTQIVQQSSFCGYLDCLTQNLTTFRVDDKTIHTYKKAKSSPNVPSNFATCMHQGFLYISGGDKALSNEGQFLASVYKVIVNKEDFNLVEQKSMNVPKRQHTMISSGKYLFSLGGFGFVPAAHLKVVERLDDTGNWAKITDLSRERRGITAVCQGPYLFAIGGLCSNEIVMIFERMEFESSHPLWITLQIATSSYTPRCHNACISISINEILIFGGYESSKERKKDAYIFNTTEMKLTKMPDISKDDYFYQRFPVLVDETVFIIGNTIPIEVHSYNTQSLGWQKYKME